MAKRCIVTVGHWIVVAALGAAVGACSGSGSSSGAGGGSSCDASKLPTQDACVVSNALGIFVSSSLGSPGGAGTMAQPMASLDAAIAAAKTAGKRVYACAESYAEPITLHDGVSVFGYFDCAHGWSVGVAHARVAPPSTSPAATATNITSATRVEAVDLVAPDFATSSASSIALLADHSPGLQLVDATIHAGTGGRGDDGVDGTQLTDAGAGKNGEDAWADGVCTGVLCLGTYFTHTTGGDGTCSGEAGHDGGAGGNGGNAGQYQSEFTGVVYTWIALDQGVTAGFPATATVATAAGGGIGLAGDPGAAGANGADGASGANVGGIGAAGYVSANGTAGAPGDPGQGGGGSGAVFSLAADYNPSGYAGDPGWGEPGPAGGAGGCPGLPGTPGQGGGASIGIVSLGVGPTLEAVTVEASGGGDGGAAGAPSQPTAGGAGGAPVTHTVKGGDGGAGGYAGVSGNGGGGPSIGIAFQGTSPSLSGSFITPGAGGLGVPARTINGQSIPASPDGLSAASYAF